MDSFLGTETPQLAPNLDVSETDDEILVKALSLSGNKLLIKGEKKAETEEKDKHFHRIERSFGSFHRMVAFPVAVDSDKI
jgi:HSP20 family protein